MKRSRLAISVVAVASVLAAGVQPARGTFTTFEFQGVVRYVTDHGYVWYPELLDIGDPISGTVTLDLDTPDSAPEDNLHGLYEGAVVRAEGTIGQLAFSLARRDTSIVGIYNDAPPSIAPTPWDGYGQSCYVRIQPADGSGQRYEQRFQMSALDWNGTALSSDELPAFMPPLSAFWDPEEGPLFGFFGAPAAIRGVLTSWETIPEPATGTVMLLAVVVLTPRRRNV